MRGIIPEGMSEFLLSLVEAIIDLFKYAHLGNQLILWEAQPVYTIDSLIISVLPKPFTMCLLKHACSLSNPGAETVVIQSIVHTSKVYSKQLSTFYRHCKRVYL